jgi:hypothetical protein
MTSPACRLPSKVGVRWSPGNHMLPIMGREARRINENEEENNILISACGYNLKQPLFTMRTSRSALRQRYPGKRSRTCHTRGDKNRKGMSLQKSISVVLSPPCHKQINERWLIMLALQFGASLICQRLDDV